MAAEVGQPKTPRGRLLSLGDDDVLTRPEQRELFKRWTIDLDVRLRSVRWPACPEAQPGISSGEQLSET